MANRVALLRGVNVGGGNRVLMAPLRDACSAAGYTDVRSYVTSGNLVFDAAGSTENLAAELRALVQNTFDVDVSVFVLDDTQMRAALMGCPWPDSAGPTVHGIFCDAPPIVDDSIYEQLKVPNEVLEIRGNVAWFYAPDGVGRSKLLAQMHKVISAKRFTARNLNTIRKLVEMLDA